MHRQNLNDLQIIHNELNVLKLKLWGAPDENGIVPRLDAELKRLQAIIDDESTRFGLLSFTRESLLEAMYDDNTHDLVRALTDEQLEHIRSNVVTAIAHGDEWQDALNIWTQREIKDEE